MAAKDLTAARLRELLDYDPANGQLRWRVNRKRAQAGAIAGTARQDGYRYIGIDGSHYSAHRLAWLHIHGSWPRNQIDHMDGDRANNRLANLRDVERDINAQNQRSARSRSSSGVLGCHQPSGSAKWAAQIKVAGKISHLGMFDSLELARQAYVAAKRKLHAGCTL